MLQTRRQFDSANALRFLIFFPTGTGEITAYDALDRQRLRFLHDHRTAGDLFAKWPQLFWKIVEIGGNEVIVDLAELVEPKRRELIEHRAFFRDRVRQDDVESRNTIGGDKEKRVAEIEDFAHFPAPQFFNAWKIDHRLC